MIFPWEEEALRLTGPWDTGLKFRRILKEQESQLQQRVDEEGASEVFATLKAVMWGGAIIPAPSGVRCKRASTYPK